MPFTFSHPAAVVPLKYIHKKWVSMSALITGSMAPDFEAFIRMNDHKIYGHTWLGMFWFDLPLGLILLFVFHNIVRNPLIMNLPAFLRRRFIQYTSLNWNKRFAQQPLAIMVCLLIGIATHLGWDFLTHSDGLFPFVIVDVMGKRMVIYFLLQAVSSIFGFIVILITVWRLPTQPIAKRFIFTYWFIATITAWLIAYIRLDLLINLKLIDRYLGPYKMSDKIIVVCIGSFLIGIIIASFLAPQEEKRPVGN